MVTVQHVSTGTISVDLQDALNLLDVASLEIEQALDCFSSTKGLIADYRLLHQNEGPLGVGAIFQASQAKGKTSANPFETISSLAFSAGAQSNSEMGTWGEKTATEHIEDLLTQAAAVGS